MNFVPSRAAHSIILDALENVAAHIG